MEALLSDFRTRFGGGIREGIEGVHRKRVVLRFHQDELSLFFLSFVFFVSLHYVRVDLLFLGLNDEVCVFGLIVCLINVIFIVTCALLIMVFVS